MGFNSGFKGLKDILYKGEGRHITVWCWHTFPFLYLYFLLKMAEWSHRNMLWLKQPTEHSMFRCFVCVDLIRRWNTYWTYCITGFGFVHFELFVRFVCNSMWGIYRFSCFCHPLILSSPARTFSWCLLPSANSLSSLCAAILTDSTPSCKPIQLNHVLDSDRPKQISTNRCHLTRFNQPY